METSSPDDAEPPALADAGAAAEVGTLGSICRGAARESFVPPLAEIVAAAKEQGEGRPPPGETATETTGSELGSVLATARSDKTELSEEVQQPTACRRAQSRYIPAFSDILDPPELPEGVEEYNTFLCRSYEVEEALSRQRSLSDSELTACAGTAPDLADRCRQDSDATVDPKSAMTSATSEVHEPPLYLEPLPHVGATQVDAPPCEYHEGVFVPPWPYAPQWPLCCAPTTLELRNLPAELSTEGLVEHLEAWGFQGLYDFVYVEPFSQSSRKSSLSAAEWCSGRGHGSAVVNLLRHSYGCALASKLHRYSAWQGTSGGRACEVSWSYPQQGLAELVEEYRNHPSMHPNVPEAMRPVLLVDGWRATLPPPTRRIRAPRSR